MFSKLGRGGGRGGGKRPFPPPPPSGLHRHAAPGGARLPIGGAVRNNRPRGGPLPPAAPPAREESFSLVPGDPDFAAIIRLTPDIFDEIRRLEAQGGAARIKFASNANNLPDNVIDVGGKEFNFTWAQELGVCDIYEECKSGENGHGLLVECGSAWRKLNVQRILDESTKNHVKMRSEEAERQMKSRKAIILDSANPSIKNQVKSMAAAGVDGSNRRMNWTRKEPPKKRKVESSQDPFSGPPKLTSRSGVSSKTTTKARPSLSPSSSPHGQPEPATSVSPFGTGNSSNPEDISEPLNLNKEDVDKSEKEMPTNVHGATHETIGHKWAIDDQQMDLRSILITLLSQNTKGMTLMALEKAVDEAIPNSGKKIESIIKNIATYLAPGRYFLKPGVELETSKQRVSESGSSPETARNHTSASKSVFLEKDTSGKNKQRSPVSSKVDDESEPFENFDLKEDDPTPYTSERIIKNDNEGKPCSSSGSGSDSESESDSSDSGSDSESQSRSKSRSSSDSEGDGSSSGKEGSDVEVQITTSDDEAEHKNEAAELKIRSSLRACSTSDDHEQIDIVGNDEGQNASPHIDLNDAGRDRDTLNAHDVTETFPIGNNTEASEKSKSEVTKSIELDLYQTNSTFSDKRMSLSPDNFKHSEAEQNVKKIGNDTIKRGVNQSINEKHTMMKDRAINEHPDVSERIVKSKSKRAPDSENVQEKPESAKRSKTASIPQAMSSAKSSNATSPENSNYISPDRPKQDLDKDQMVQNLAERGRLGASNDWNASMLVTDHSGLRTSDPNGRMKMLDNMEKKSRYVENLGWSTKHTEGLSFRPNDMPMQEKHSLLKDKSCKNIPDENGDTSEKYPVKNIRENFPVDKVSSIPSSYKRKYVENNGISKDNRGLSHMQNSDMVNSSIVSGKRGMLRRELSDLELGEFREPSSGEETGGVSQQFDRKGSVKSLDITTDSSNLDTSRRNVVNALSESKKQFLANLKTGIQGHQDGFNRRVPVDDVMDSTRTQQRAVPALIQQLSRVDHTDTDVMFHSDKPAEVADKNDRRAQGMGLENHMGGHKKAPDGMLPKDVNIHDGRMSIKTVKESKPQRSNASRNSIDRSNTIFLRENDNNGRKRRDSSSDDDNSFYSKYAKDKPELKGPIKDFSQYKEYVQEYREKYGHYCSLNKNLENTQNEFLKVGNDLHAAKERDMQEYYILVEDLKEMYHQHGVRHKQMKKIFILLHDELKILKQRIRDFAHAYTQE